MVYSPFVLVVAVRKSSVRKLLFAEFADILLNGFRVGFSSKKSVFRDVRTCSVAFWAF